ncbi:PEP-CTERM sorting domain-containing protein [Ideonella sp. DXS22W]|uniref:PEP-CTERM sorting domain-containing protein n=1 Tax=Pseudaquabacterium inlustre TaxID=2984192 RepID=A0ABU9CK17_9BURK
MSVKFRESDVRSKQMGLDGFFQFERLAESFRFTALAICCAVFFAPASASAITHAETRVTINISPIDLDVADGIGAAIIGRFDNSLTGTVSISEMNLITGKTTELNSFGGIPGAQISNGFSSAASTISYRSTRSGVTLSFVVVSEVAAEEAKAYPVYRLSEAFANLTPLGISVTPNTGLRVTGNIDYSLIKSGTPEFERSYAQGRIVISGDGSAGYMNDDTLSMSPTDVSESRGEGFSFDLTSNTSRHTIGIEISSTAAVLMTAVPEPATNLLLLIGAIGLAIRLKRQRIDGFGDLQLARQTLS